MATKEEAFFFRQPRFRICSRLVGRVLAPLAMKVHARIAGVAGSSAIGRLFALGAQALERSSGFDQSTVNRKVLGAGQLQLARLRYHGAEKLAGHVVLQQAPPIAAKGGVVEARARPSSDPGTSGTKGYSPTARRTCARCARCTAPSRARLSATARAELMVGHFTVHLLEQRREFFECHFSQFLDQSDRMVRRNPLLGVHQRQHGSLWPIMSPHLPLPPQPHRRHSTVPMQNHRSIRPQRHFSTAC
jgi:hypothetical protein